MAKNATPKRAREPVNAIAARYNARPDDPAIAELPELSVQHQLFVKNYVQHFNAARAAREAGYSVDTARAIGWELLTRPDIQKHITYAKAQLGELHFDLANQLVGQLRAMLGADITSILDAEGNLTDPATWGEPEKLLLAGIEVEERMTGEGDAQELVRTKKVKLESRRGVIDQLSKILGLYIVKNQTLGKDGNPVDPAATQTIVNMTFAEAPPNVHRAGQKPGDRPDQGKGAAGSGRRGSKAGGARSKAG